MIRIIAGAGLIALLALAAPEGWTEARAESGGNGWSGKVRAAGTAEQTIESWPELARTLARATIVKYGRPDEVGENALVWYANGPWKKTIVHRRAWPHYAAIKDKDYLENTIGYNTPTDKLDDLTRFDKKLDMDQLSAELSSRSDSESMNFLSLNLADEIVKGKRTVEEAREFYARTSRLSAAGKSSPYLNGFLFEVRNDASPHPWRRH